MRELKSIKKIIIHCSDSGFGDVNLIDKWHKERGWKGCGYHYVITNGILTHGKPYNPASDGIVQQGRQLRETGAHCKGHNHDSIGICLIGRRHFSGKQLYQALPDTVRFLRNELGIPLKKVFGHREFNPGKTCPNIEPRLIRLGMV